MHSRGEVIRQALAGMEPEQGTDGMVNFSGAVAQVHIISHATIHIGSLHIVTNELRTRPRKRKGRKHKANR